MQNIITLGQINDALKFTTVTAAQLAEMGFAALVNKPICEALPTEQSRRLRNAKLYPAESIGQIRVALAKRLAAPASCLHQIQEPITDAQIDAVFESLPDGASGFLKTWGYRQFARELLARHAAPVLAAQQGFSVSNAETSQAAPAVVAVPDDARKHASDALAFAEEDNHQLALGSLRKLDSALAATPAADAPLYAEMLAALQSVGMDAVGVGGGENTISDSARAKVEAVLEKIGAPWPSSDTAAAAPVVLPEPVMFAIDRFDAYFRSANAVPPNARISVPTSEWQALRALLAAGGQAQAVQHPDDVAVDVLAGLMKAKLAKQRSKGYGGWDTDCTRERLSELLRGHVDKGDPVDVANFCAFLLARGEGIAPQAQARSKSGWTFEELEAQLAEAIKADPENCRAVGEELLKSIHDNFNALKAAGWDGPVDSPVEVVTDLLNLLDEAKAASPQAQADARDAEQERWMEIGKAIERACIDQPDSTEIVISLERDAGTVTMFDPDGNEHDQFSHEDGFAGVVNAAIEAAIAAAKGE